MKKYKNEKQISTCDRHVRRRHHDHRVRRHVHLHVHHHLRDLHDLRGLYPSSP